MESKHEVGQISMQDVHLARADRDKAQDALRQAMGGEKQVQRALSRYDVGQTDFLGVLQTQAQWVGARVGLVNIRSDRLTQRVDLHLALGGSFEAAQ